MSEVKFCKDCKFYRKGVAEWCLRPVLNLVSGEKYFPEMYCQDERLLSCGKEAKYFEQKEKVDE